MQDEMIVDLYWKRDESAISENGAEIWAVSFKDRLQYPLRLGGQQGNRQRYLLKGVELHANA